MAIPIKDKIEFNYSLGKWCQNCGRVMKNPKLTHCSDECLMTSIKNSKTLNPEGQGAQGWNDESDPWV